MTSPAGSYELLTAPASEPVTVDEVKAHARIETTADDTLLGYYITGARQLVESITGKALITQTWVLTLDNWPADKCDEWWDGVREAPISITQRAQVTIRKAPFLAISSVVTRDEDDTETTWASTNYYVDKRHGFGRLNLRQGQTWPAIVSRSFGAIKITFTAGYGTSASDVPMGLRQAIKDLVAHWYENREALGDSMSEVPMKTASLINQYLVAR
jgi:hypothetical protein